jgi:prolyl 4-hydroxylase
MIILLIFILIIIGLIYLYINKGKNLNRDKNVNKDESLETKYVDKDDYDIIEIPNFLTSEECDKIIELSEGNMITSKVYSQNEDLYDNKIRISQQTWLSDNDPFIKDLSDKIKSYTNTNNNYLEEFQVVNYKPGGFYKPHYDACVGNKTRCERMNKEGPRYLTFLIYLNDNFEGGETIFPKINRSIKPKKGKAVIFQNVDDN